MTNGNAHFSFCVMEITANGRQLPRFGNYSDVLARATNRVRNMLGRRRRFDTGFSRATRMRPRYATRSFTRSNRRRPTSGRGITDHYDRRLIYRKRRMPRYMRKRWRGFVKKTLAVSTKLLGTKTVVYNKQLVSSLDVKTVSNSQDVNAVSLYGVEGDNTSMLGYRDLNNISDLMTSINNTGTVFFGSAILDLTVTNVNRYYDGVSSSPWNWKNEIDVYEISFKRELNRASVGGVIYKKLNLETMFNSGSAGTIGDITSGSVYLFVAQTGGILVANPIFNWRARVRFTDV